MADEPEAGPDPSLTAGGEPFGAATIQITRLRSGDARRA